MEDIIKRIQKQEDKITEVEEKLDTERKILSILINNNIHELIDYVNTLKIVEAIKLANKYSFKLTNENLKLLNESINKRRTGAIYYPILNKLKEIGISKDKVIELDKYINRCWGLSRVNSIYINSATFYPFLNKVETQKFIEFLIKNDLASLVYNYKCTGEHEGEDEEDYYNSTNIDFYKDDIVKMKELIELRKDESEEGYKKLNKFYQENGCYTCAYCDTSYDLEKIVSDYKKIVSDYHNIDLDSDNILLKIEKLPDYYEKEI